MRKLNTRDVFAFSRLLKKMNCKEEFKKLAKNGEVAEDATEFGVDVIWFILDCASNAGVEEMLYSFVAPIIGTKTEDVANMEINDFIETLMDIAKNNDLSSFFKSASKLTQLI